MDFEDEIRKLAAEHVSAVFGATGRNELYTLLREEYPEDDSIDEFDMNDLFSVEFVMEDDGRARFSMKVDERFDGEISDILFENLQKRAVSRTESLVEEALSDGDAIDRAVGEYLKENLSEIEV